MDIRSIKQRFGLVGKSPKLDRAIETAMRVAKTNLSVLVQGESGVGKESISKIIHELSKRKHGPFIAINCGAIPEGTINSELFGHEKGAFTGATSDRKGYFETVNGGTIFLDEVGEMPLDTQAYLLRILESGEFIKVGSSKVNKTDVRVVAATNANIKENIQKGKFREDLFYRLNTVPVYVPALHERVEDIHILFRKFASDFAGEYRTDPIRLDDLALQVIQHYRWPGNIRELRNLVQQLSIMTEEPIISVDELLLAAPHIRDRNLPVKTGIKGEQTSFEEREILYKFLFEMKSDLNDLKNLVFELIQSNNLSVNDIGSIKQLSQGTTNIKDYVNAVRDQFSPPTNASPDQIEFNPAPVRIEHFEDAEESLSLEDHTIKLIKKALERHKGRRKDAAIELGISERTLYRKIKEHDIEE